MQEYRKPPCKRTKQSKVGKGGNGQVYLANNEDQVCKVFNVDPSLSHEERS